MAAAEKKGAYLLLYPILWIAGLMMWISLIVADQRHFSASEK
jgi:hypothetical protein